MARPTLATTTLVAFLAFAVVTLTAFLAHTPPVSLSVDEPEWAEPDIASANRPDANDSSASKTSVSQVHPLATGQSVLF